MAPGGVVTYLHPYEGNEEALGHDLFADPARVEEATLARETGEIILSGPLTLKQGGKGLISRKPIYSSVSDEPDHFWGFVMIVLDLDMINEQFGLEKYTYEGYDYRLYREYGDEILIATESTDSELTDAVEVDVAVPTIMDIMMPEMDGLTATRAIRSMKRADMQTIPVIAMTAHAFAEDRKAAIEAGMNGYVTKPIDVAMLIEEIRTVMLS
jgi:CheY-like chemotaxis protein